LVNTVSSWDGTYPGYFKIATDGRVIAGSGASSGRFRNSGGTVTKQGTSGTVVFEVPFDSLENNSYYSYARVNVADGAGTLRFEGGGSVGGDTAYFRGSGNGRIEFAGGDFHLRNGYSSWLGVVPGHLNLSGTILSAGRLVLPSRSWLEGAGLEITGGELVADGDRYSRFGGTRLDQVTLSTLRISGGRVSGPGTIATHLFWNSGELGADGATLRGTVELGPGASRDLAGGRLINTGSVTWNLPINLSNGATVENQGTLNLAAGAAIMAADTSLLALQNSGTLAGPATGRADIEVAALNTNRVEVSGAALVFGAGYTQTGNTALTLLDSGRIEGSLRIEAGQVSGSGTIAGDLDNAGGSLLPGGHRGLGHLDIDGNFSQGVNGRIESEIDTSGADQIRVVGNATLAGRLLTEGLDGYQIPLGAVITPLTYGSVIGTFTLLSGAYGDEVLSQYGPGALTLAITGRNGAVTWIGAGAAGDWFDPANWSGGIVPGPADDVLLDAGVGPLAITGGSVAVQRIHAAGECGSGWRVLDGCRRFVLRRPPEHYWRNPRGSG